jgi:hypothetical protein
LASPPPVDGDVDEVGNVLVVVLVLVVVVLLLELVDATVLDVVEVDDATGSVVLVALLTVVAVEVVVGGGTVVVVGGTVVVVVVVVVVVGTGRGGAMTHGVENAIGRYIDGFGQASRNMLRALFDTVTTRLPAPSRHGARWAW